jgi:peroxiredoxin
MSASAKRAPVGVRIFGLLAGLAIVALMGLGVRHLVRHWPEPPLVVGDRLPSIELTNLNGDDVGLGDGHSKGTAVYNIFASWCPPCNEELPQVTRAAAILKQRGVAFIGIDQGESSQRVESFASANGIAYPLLIDSTHVTVSRLNARVIPETLIVHNGVLRQIIVGPTTTSQILYAAGRAQ